MCEECKKIIEDEKIYELTKEYYNLDDDGKILINAIVKYCDENGKFPTTKILEKGINGMNIHYFYVYFHTCSMEEIYQKYINRKKLKPKMMHCSKCGNLLPFTNQYFSKKKTGAFGLNRICRKCGNKSTSYYAYKKRGIDFTEKSIEQYTAIDWYEQSIEINRLIIPRWCFNKDEVIKLTRYVAFDKLKLKTKEDICNNFTTGDLRKNHLLKYFNVYNNFLLYIQDCFPEYNIKSYDLKLSNNVSDEFIINMFKEWIEEKIKSNNYKNDVPMLISSGIIKKEFYKLYDLIIVKKRFKNFYEFCCKCFPQYALDWDEKQFNIVKSKDGITFDSFIEKDIYEFIKGYNPIFQYILPIGNKHHKGKFVFELGDDYEQNKFCPDFAIEYANVNNKKVKYKRPIIIEYYGLVDFNRTDNKWITNYNHKTLEKERFYKSNKDIYYIGIFPQDIKNNYEGLKKKLESFFMLNFNININDTYVNEQIIKNIVIENILINN